MSASTPFDRLQFYVHFVFGAILGAGAGLVIWLKLDGPGTFALEGSIFIGAGASACGLFAGFFGDDFWRGVADLFRWW